VPIVQGRAELLPHPVGVVEQRKDVQAVEDERNI
jgi:hypothetical protein